MGKKKRAEELLRFIKKATSPFHAVAAAAAELEKAGFRELQATALWQLEAGGRYYVRIYGSMLVAFSLGQNPRAGLRAAAAHTDFPCFRLKPSPVMVDNGYGRLNVEGYGGLIRSSWMDRPLSIAGKVVLAGEHVFAPQAHLVDFKRPLLIVPNLAIHMNRKINEGMELNMQKDMLPLAGLWPQEMKDGAFFAGFLAAELGCAAEEILSYELTLYPAEQGCILGCQEEFISSPRLDNMTSVKACLAGITAAGRDGINLVALFDNEEVGSQTKQGAGSLVLPQILERIYAALGYSRQELLADVAGGFLLSVDVAHAMHPNAPEKNDMTNKPLLNGGVVLKTAASQSYAGDAEAVAVVTGLCRQAGVPCQHFVNRADARGGSTLGSIVSAVLPMRTMDIGVPILAMHSARETMGGDDQTALEELLKQFFQAV